MKKRVILALIAILLLVALVSGSISLAKYITTLHDERSVLSTGYFYFRSNVLGEGEEIPAFEILGDRTEFVLANAQDSETVTPEDINYTISYSVLVSGEGESAVWEKKSDMTTSATLTGGVYSAHTLTASPITWDRDGDGTAEIYRQVMVEAKTTTPHEKTLRARFDFIYVPMEISYSYDKVAGVIAMTVATNSDAGQYLITWAPGLLPDSADPNGILTYALKSEVVCGACGHVYNDAAGEPENGIGAGTVFGTLPDSYTCPDCGAGKSVFRGEAAAELQASTMYRFYFFVPAEARASIDDLFDSLMEYGGEEAVREYLTMVVGCIPYSE